MSDDRTTTPRIAWLPHALWRKGILEARLLLVSLLAVIFVFNTIYVWLTNQVELGALAAFLQALPKQLERIAGVPFSTIATPAGRLSLAFVDPVPVFVAASWGIARGSDCISGEIGRGTMELLLAQPIRRSALVVTQAVITTVGAGLIACFSILGLWLGISLVGLQVEIGRFVPSAINLFGFSFFLSAISTLASSLGNDRRRTIGVIVGFYLISLLLKIVGRAVPWLSWLLFASFFTAFDPHMLAIQNDTAYRRLIIDNSVLIGVGLASYVLAAVIFTRRDVPTPS